LRHEHLSTTGRYAHVTEEDLHAGMEAVETATPKVAPDSARRAANDD
jgi:hypothetical protein